MTYYAGVEENALVSVTGEPITKVWMEITDELAYDIIDNPRLLLEYVVLGDDTSGRRMVLRSDLIKSITGELFLLTMDPSTPDCEIVIDRATNTVALDPRTRFLNPYLTVYLVDLSGLVCKHTVTYTPIPFVDTTLTDVLIFSNQPFTTVNIYETQHI